jgi:putative ABC transport system permease protein
MHNYLAVLLRTIGREKLYTAINILGLALGFACCIVLGLFLTSELTYDQHFKGHENIYRVVNEFTTNGKNDRFAATSRVIGLAMQEEYPSVVKDYVRFQSNSGSGGIAIRRTDKVFYWENSYFASPNVFEIFKHDVLLGDPKTALLEGGNVAISAKMAKYYFGSDNPIGQTLTTDSGNASKVTLVFADLPPNTHLKYDALFSDNLPFLRQADSATVRRQALANISIYTYLLMDPSFRPADWARMSEDFGNKYLVDLLKTVNTSWRSWLQPLREVHLDGGLGYDRPNGNRMYLYGCAAVALIILVIACINYMNLATARATRRARSIGIRKILGASRLALAVQFLLEAILFALLALILGAVIVEVALKFTPINTLMADQVRLDLLQEPVRALWLIGMAVVIGLLAGIYPAFYLSSWAPLTALTGKHLAGKGNLRMREFLVLLQFTISATAIATTLLMMAQMHYVANMPLGFEKHNRLVVTLRGAPAIEKIPSIRNELLRNGNVHGVAVAAQTLGQNVGIQITQLENEDGSMGQQLFNNFPIGEDFEKVLGLQITQGRNRRRAC